MGARDPTRLDAKLVAVLAKLISYADAKIPFGHHIPSMKRLIWMGLAKKDKQRPFISTATGNHRMRMTFLPTDAGRKRYDEVRDAVPKQRRKRAVRSGMDDA